jgi:hypothetical protein
MKDIPDVRPYQSGHLLIESQIQENFERVRSGVSENIEPFVQGLRGQFDKNFEWLACNLIKGYDSVKAYRSQPVEIAHRTMSVSRFIVVLAQQPVLPKLDIATTITAHQSTANPYESLYYSSLSALNEAQAFGSLLKEFSPSIDPECDEPELIKLFGGFTLLALGHGEVRRIKEELEATADMFQYADFDPTVLFDS